MSRHHSSVVTPAEVVRILRSNPRRWVVPVVAFTIVAAGYAVFHRPAWDASQALMVRDEAMGAATRPGKFQQPDDMKTVQETILELARSRTVLAAALAEVGPVSDVTDDQSYPSDAVDGRFAKPRETDPAQGCGIRQDGSVLSECRSRKLATGPLRWPPPSANNCNSARKIFAIRKLKA